VERAPQSKPDRKRLRLKDFDYSNPSHVFFITICARDKAAPFLNSELAEEIVSSLMVLKERKEFPVYCYCLMPDHLHIVISPSLSSGSVSRIVRSFKSFTTKIAWEHEVSGRLWQKSFYDHVVRNDENLMSICQYILMNPVRKALVERAEDWEYSGLMDPLPV
jgi:REP element-mobilizing transposase RayT